MMLRRFARRKDSSTTRAFIRLAWRGTGRQATSAGEGPAPLPAAPPCHLAVPVPMPPHLLPPVCHNLPSLSHAPCRRIPPTRGSPHDSPPPTSVPGGLKSSLGAASQFAETHRTFLTLIAAGTISTFYLGGTFSGQKSDLKHETEQRKSNIKHETEQRKLDVALSISKAREEVARAETAMLRVFFGHEHHAAVEKAQEKAQKALEKEEKSQKDLEKAEKSQEAEKGQEWRSLWASLWASWGGWGGERSSTAAEPSLRLET